MHKSSFNISLSQNYKQKCLAIDGGGRNMGQEVRNKMKGVLKNLTEDDGVDSRK